MPYSLSNPPKQIKSLSKHEKKIWISAFNSAYKEYNKDEEKAAKIAWAAVSKYKDKKKSFDSNDLFEMGNRFTDPITLKTEKGTYIMGYASTFDVDRQMERFTRPVLTNIAKSMLDPRHNKVMLFHDLDDIPIAKIIPSLKVPQGEVYTTGVDTKGLFIVTKLNDAHPRSEEVFNSVQNGFLDGMSIRGKSAGVHITYDETLKSYVKEYKDFRYMETTLTSFPVNPEARITGTYVAKSLKENILLQGGNRMTEETTDIEQPEPSQPNEANSEVEKLKSELAELKEKVDKIEEAKKPATEGEKTETEKSEQADSTDVKKAFGDESKLIAAFKEVVEKEVKKSLSKENLSEIIALIHAEPVPSKAVVKKDVKKSLDLDKMPTEQAFKEAIGIALEKGLLQRR